MTVARTRLSRGRDGATVPDMKLLSSISVFLLSLALTACGGSTPEPRMAPGGVGLSVQLLEPGAEPRDTLRYERVAGTRDALVVQIAANGLLETAEGAALVTPPILDLGIETGGMFRVREGVFGYQVRFRVIGVRMPEGTTAEQAETAGRLVAPLANVTGTFEIDDRGLTQRADLTIPEDAPPRLLTILGSIRMFLLSIPFPAEAVGVGARWEVTRLVDVRGIRTTQTVTYSLAERVGGTLRLGVTMHSSAAPQSVPVGTDGTQMDVEAYEASMVGSAIVKLDRIIPLSEVRGTSELRATLRRGLATEPIAHSGAAEVRVVPLAEETPAP